MITFNKRHEGRAAVHDRHRRDRAGAGASADARLRHAPLRRGGRGESRCSKTAKITAGSVVVLSDGADTGSAASRDDVVEAAKAAHARVFAVGLRSGQFDPTTLRSLATGTAGDFSEASSAEDLSQIYDQLGTRLSQRVPAAVPLAAGSRLEGPRLGAREGRRRHRTGRLRRADDSAASRRELSPWRRRRLLDVGLHDAHLRAARGRAVRLLPLRAAEAARPHAAEAAGRVRLARPGLGRDVADVLLTRSPSRGARLDDREVPALEPVGGRGRAGGHQHAARLGWRSGRWSRWSW